MTTIAYRDGVLAADSQSTRADLVASLTITKIRAIELDLNEPALVGGTGDFADASAFMDWLASSPASRGPRPALPSSTVILIRARRVTLFEGTGQFDLDAEFGAWGSGAGAALGAMHMGATAKHAVEIASRVDIYTGGKIVTLALPHLLAPEDRA